MSNYNSEEGTIQLPKSKFAAIKKKFIADYNIIMEQELINAKDLRNHVITSNKGKRHVEYCIKMLDDAERYNVSSETIFKMCDVEGNKKPRAVNRKIVKFANSKTMQFSLNGEGSITFDKEHKTINYYVSENNHAVEAARRSKVGRLFFRTMNSITWTNGSGGSLIGNDEYNREDGGGADYVTSSFGNKK